METLTVIYILSAIVTIAYIAYEHKELLEKYKYDKGEFTKGAAMAVLIPAINTLIAGTVILGTIVQIYYRLKEV
jgi:multisubunit Na+/H+ antiporter MnhB subunit